MEQVEVTIHVDGSPEVVWPYMADLPFIRALPFTTMEVVGKPVNVGTINRLTFTMPLGLTFRFDEEVTEWVEGERIAYRAISGWEMEAWAVLCQEDSGTRFQFILHYQLRGLWKLTPRWFMPPGLREGTEQLAQDDRGEAE